MSKEDFLETLKDPVSAGMKRATRELLDKYPDKLIDIVVGDDVDKDGFIIAMKATNSRTLIVLEDECMETFCRHVKGLYIDMTDVPVKSVTNDEYFKVFYASWKIH